MRRLVVILLGLALTSCPDELEEAVRQYGFRPVRPASTFWQPGAIIAVFEEKPFRVGYICSAEQVMGDNFRPRESAATSTDLARFSRRAVDLSAKYLDVVRGDVGMGHVSSIKMSLSNVHIFVINDAEVDARIGKIDPVCMRHVRRRLDLAQGAPSMIAQSLQADVVYTVQYNKASKLDSEAQIAVLKDVALKLGVEASELGGHTIRATGLIWGIQEDPSMVYILDREHMRRYGRPDSRLVDPVGTASLVDGYEIWHREPRLLEPCLPPSDEALGEARDDEETPAAKVVPTEDAPQGELDLSTPSCVNEGADEKPEADAEPVPPAEARPGDSTGDVGPATSTGRDDDSRPAACRRKATRRPWRMQGRRNSTG